MSFNSNRKELFDKITRAKQLNQSQCDQLKNLNTRSMIIGRVLNERTGIIKEECLIVLDDSFKCNWYGFYKYHTEGELQKIYSEIYVKYIGLTNHIKQRSKYILNLRKEMLKYKVSYF